MEWLNSVGAWFVGLWDQFYTTMIVDDRYMQILWGLGNTLTITVCAILMGIVIGTIVAMVKARVFNPRNAALKAVLKALDIIGSIYLTVIRGTPMILQLMIMYFLILTNISNGVTIACIAFGINSGAYVAEVIRTGILSVDKGQMEAGRSLGLTQTTTMFKIIFPQALKNVLPALGNEFIALLKETSVAGYIGIHDLTKGSDIIRTTTYDSFTPLISAGLVYLVLVVGLTSLLGCFERRLRKSDIR